MKPVISIKPRGQNLARGRVLLAGDAAGLIDPVTAECITYAIWSGQLAAHAILDCTFDPAKVRGRYQSLVSAEILVELKALGYCMRSRVYPLGFCENMEPPSANE